MRNTSSETNDITCHSCKLALPNNNWSFDRQGKIGVYMYYDKIVDNRKILKYIKRIGHHDRYKYLECVYIHDKKLYKEISMAAVVVMIAHMLDCPLHIIV